MKATKTLLLDLDGTLLGSKPTLHLTFIFQTLLYFARRGIGPVTALRALHGLRMGIERHQPGLVNSKRAARLFGDVLKLDEVPAKKMAVEMTHEVFAHLESCFFPIRGAAEFLSWARTRYELVLATNAVWPREIVMLRLKWAGLDPGMFNFIANNDEMHFTKPSTQYYEELLEKLKLRAEACLMIGDSVRKDLPARKTGIPVFLMSDRAADIRAVATSDGVWKGNFTALKELLQEVQ
ncbi:MAG: HAD family hydrolase [Deltaproteobacteria bacterium]|nr:HAD family hydrolase [Deltaproteobacteria bacterium]